VTLSGNRDRAWQGLTAFSDVFTCYSSAIAAWLAFEAERLAKSCARLVWLNPLLRYAGFEARPAGIRAPLPYVDDFLPVHNLETLTDLASALARPRHRDIAVPRAA